MFENFEREEHEIDRPAVFAVLCMVILPAIIFLGFQFLPGMRNDPPQTSHTLQTDDAQLRRVNELCASLPRPEKFEFISSYENGGLWSPTSGSSSTVIYRYNSTRGAEEIMPAFLVWFNENDWFLIPGTSTYKKGNQSVYISAGSNDNQTFYEIYCAERN